jgi:hypothetical protein
VITTDLLKDLELLVRSRHGLILLETVEEDRAELLLRYLADQLRLSLFTWSQTRGLCREGMDQPVYGSTDPGNALSHCLASQHPSLFLFHGLAQLLEGNHALVARVKDVAAAYAQRPGALVLLGDGNMIPESIRHHATVVQLPPPTGHEFDALLQRIVRDLSATGPAEVKLTPAETQRLLANLQGLTLMEAEKVLTKAIVEDGRLTADDIGAVLDAKRQVIEREGLLEYYPLEENLTDIAGLRGLKDWLNKRRAIVADPRRAAEFGLEFPKGVLLVGVPGCGKSLCAKAVAMEWHLPLLKLDPSTLYNKYVGESERNFRRAMTIAERMAPVVLWIDEIEKAFATTGGEQDGGLSTRILGTFLSWLQERRGDVFIVATANDVSRLPPELLRKGRFDEIFFVDLPTPEARGEIFRIHLRRRKQPDHVFDVDALARGTEGFSGAEIEQVIVSAMYSVFADNTELSTSALLREVEQTSPLSRIMDERFRALREWASERTVPAD